MAKVFAQIVSDIEFDADSLEQAQTILKSIIEHSQVNFDVDSGRVLQTYTPTKDWHIGAQLNLGAKYEVEAEYFVPSLTFDQEREAQKVLSELQKLFIAYGHVSVQDLMDLVDVPGTFADSKHGWRDLRNARVLSSPDRWTLMLPQAVRL